MQKRNKTGGRRKGTPNKASAINREFVQSLLNKQGDKLERELCSLQGKDYVNALLSLMEFAVPKLQRQQVFVSNETRFRPKEPIIREIFDEETECSSFIITHAN